MFVLSYCQEYLAMMRNELKKSHIVRLVRHEFLSFECVLHISIKLFHILTL